MFLRKGAELVRTTTNDGSTDRFPGLDAQRSSTNLQTRAVIEKGLQFEMDKKSESIRHLMSGIRELSKSFDEFIQEPKALMIQLESLYDAIRDIEERTDIKADAKESVKERFLEQNVPVKMEDVVYSKPFVSAITNLLVGYFALN